MTALTAMTAIAPHLQILLAPWHQRLNQGSLWVWAVIAGLAYLVPAFTYFTGGSAKGLMLATVLLLMFVLLAVWGSTVDSLHMQNSPTTARLVPGHVGRVRQSLLTAWVAIGLLAATIIGLAFGHGGFFGVTALALMFATERFMCYAYRSPWVLTVFLVSVPYVVKGTDLGDWLLSAAVHLYSAQPVLPLFAIALVLTLVMVRFAVGRGDARHRRTYEVAKSWRAQMQAMQSGKTPVHFQGRIAWRLTWFMWAPYRWWMRRLLNQPQTSTRHVMAKVLLGFGPNLHWITYASFMIVIVLIAGAIAGTIAIGGAGSAKDGIAAVLMGLLFGIVGAPLLMLVTQWQMLQQSQREQALVLLLPGMPRGAALNRALAAQWLWRFWLTWLVASVALWVAIQFTNDSPAGIGLLIPSMAACLIHVRDWSVVRFTESKLQGVAVVAYFVAGAACVWALFKFELSPWPFMALALVPTLLALRWKWNRLDGYQQALPAGRWG